MPRDPINSLETQATAGGAAAQEVRDARVFGPRSNAISIQLASNNGNEEHPADRLHPALLGSDNSRLRASIFAETVANER
jgi:hypothetical protein